MSETVNEIYLKKLLEVFMKCATKYAETVNNPDQVYVAGMEFGHAFGIYDTLSYLDIIDRETAEELYAVLFDRREVKTK